MNDKIRLNFYPLVSQELEYKVWRIEYSGEKREGFFADLYRNTLPIDDNLDEREDYWISFEPQERFKEFTCKPYYNHKLTQYYLYHLICKKVEGELSEDDYILPQDPFRKTINFVLEEHTEGKEVVWLEPYYLHINEKFGFLVDFKFFKNPNIQFSREIQRLSLSLDKNYRSNRNFYLDKYQKLQEFQSKFKDKLFPLNTALDISWELENLLIYSLKMKSYIFSNGRMRNSQFKGLKEVGPLEGIMQPMTLVFIYRERDKYLKGDLIDGLKGKLSYVLFNGLQRMFSMDDEPDIHDISLSDFSQKSLDEAISTIRDLKDSTSLIIPILILDRPDDAVYYKMKYKLLKENLPLQVVTTQLLRKRDALKWSISNIALQIFAKLGGKPWKVKPSNEKSIIFGIGQAHQKVNGKVKKYFAYSVSTDSSGIYKKIDVLGKSENEHDYLDQLKGNMIKTIREHILDGYTNVVLHIPFKIKQKEIETIHNTIKEYIEKEDVNISDVDFIVLKVNQKNKYFGYAYTNSLVPYESTYTLLSNKPKPPAYLVWFEGLQYHRETILKRVPGPIYIEFYWSSKDLSEKERVRYLQDLLNLSGANWRGFNAKNIPISIYYCELVTSFLKSFPAEVENIANIINPWFL